MVGNTRLGRVLLGQVLPSVHVNDVDADERVYHARVQLKVARFFNSDLQSKLLLVRLLELFVKLERGGLIPEHFSWGRRVFTTAEVDCKAVARRILSTDFIKVHIWHCYFSNRPHLCRFQTLLLVVVGGSCIIGPGIGLGALRLLRLDDGCDRCWLNRLDRLNWLLLCLSRGCR